MRNVDRSSMVLHPNMHGNRAQQGILGATGRWHTGTRSLSSVGHVTHQEQGSTIRRYIIWRNNHAYYERLRRIIDLANVA